MTITEFKNARPIFAVLNAFTKLSKFSQLPGNAITLVFWYSASVLNAVVIQETIGMIAQNPKKISDAYSTIVQIMLPTE